MLFSEISGLSAIKNILLQSVKNKHIAHSQLFLGNEGSANLALALAYAQFINCENPLENDSCGVCASCGKIQKFIHPDIHFVFPVTTTKKITKEALSEDFLSEWRKFLLINPYASISDWLNVIGAENKQPNISAEEARNVIKSLALKSFEATYKVMLIWLPEYFNITAANILLKILEEPPRNTIFLLVGNKADNILTTILSRTQLIKIPEFTESEINEELEKKFPHSDKIKSAAIISNGNLNLAFQMVEGQVDESHEIFGQWMRLCFDCFSKNKIIDLLELAERFQKMSKDSQKSLLVYSLQMFRESLMNISEKTELIRMPEEIKTFISNFSKVMSFEKIEFLYEKFNAAIYHLERNANPKITFFNISLVVADMIKK